MDMIPTEGFDAAVTLTDHLDHLPDKKRRELARILQILFFEVEQFRATKLSGKKAAGKVLKVVLYCSDARGDWVEDRSSGYRSDYDLLIVVNTKSFAEEHELWETLEERLLQEQISHRIETPVIPIVHCLSDVNGQLSRGRPFFTDIAEDGIVLYEEPGHPLAQPKLLSPEVARAEAQRHYDQWFVSAVEFLDGAEFDSGSGQHEQSGFPATSIMRGVLSLCAPSPNPLQSKVSPHQGTALASRKRGCAAGFRLAARHPLCPPLLRAVVAGLCRGALLVELHDQQ